MSTRDRPPEHRPQELAPSPSAHYNLDYATTNASHQEEWAGELYRRFSLPSTYTSPPPSDPVSAGLTATFGSTILQPVQSEPVLLEHRYALKSKGKDFAFLTVVKSRASSAKDPPRFFAGEDVSGKISMAIDRVGTIQYINVVLQEFVGTQAHAAVETRRQLLPQEIDNRFVNHGVVEWPFSISPSHSHDAFLSPPNSRRSREAQFADRRYNVVVTIYRRGRLTPNIAHTQVIQYAEQPRAPSTLQESPLSLRDTVPLPPVSESGSRSGSGHSSISVIPRSPSTSSSSPTPASPSNSSPLLQRTWREIKYPPFHVKGTLFHSQEVEFACELTVPSSYPAGPSIPLKLMLTSTELQAIDLIAGAPSSALDVRMHKVLAFGNDATRLAQRTLINRDCFHKMTHVGTARWHLGGPATRLPPDEGHPLPRFSIELCGEVVLQSGQEIGPSISFPDLVVMYTIGVYPFKAAGFVPQAAKGKELCIVRITLTRPPVASPAR